MHFRGWLATEEAIGPTEKTRNPALKKELERMRDFPGDDTPDAMPAPAFLRGAAKREPFKDIIGALKEKEKMSGLPLLDLLG